MRRESKAVAERDTTGKVASVVQATPAKIATNAVLAKKFAASRLVLAGDGELRGEIEARVDALGLRNAITFTGWQRDLAPHVRQVLPAVLDEQPVGLACHGEANGTHRASSRLATRSSQLAA